MCRIQTITTPDAPAAVGPYAQALVAGGFVWCSGQLGLEPRNGAFAGADVTTQTRQVLANLVAVLHAAGSGLDRVVKTTVYLADMAEFGAMNAVYEAAFGSHRPARATVQVARLPKDARVEIDAVALVGAA